MVVRKKNTRTRGRRKIGRKSPVTKRNIITRRTKRSYKPDALDGAVLIGSGLVTALKDAAFDHIGAGLIAGIYSGAVTGIMLQGEADPDTIVRRAGAIVDAAHAFMDNVNKSRGAVVVTATETIPVSDVPNGAIDPFDPIDNTDRA